VGGTTLAAFSLLLSLGVLATVSDGSIFDLTDREVSFLVAWLVFTLACFASLVCGLLGTRLVLHVLLKRDLLDFRFGISIILWLRCLRCGAIGIPLAYIGESFRNFVMLGAPVACAVSFPLLIGFVTTLALTAVTFTTGLATTATTAITVATSTTTSTTRLGTTGVVTVIGDVVGGCSTTTVVVVVIPLGLAFLVGL